MITPLFPYPAAMVKTQRTRTIAVADLHIGWEMSLAERGIHVPSQTPKLLQRLEALISTYKPDKLLVLGDMKHTVTVADAGEWHDIPYFFNELKRHIRTIYIVRGNHDGELEPLLPEDVEILPATGTVVGDVGFFHGHRWPSPALLGCKTLVMGHVHPTVAFRDPAGFRTTRQVWVKAPCDGARLAEVVLQKYNVKIENGLEETLWKHYRVKPETVQLFIMPSFNDFLGGRSLNEKGFSEKLETKKVVGPVLRSEAVDMRNAETYLLDGTFLGALSQLTSLA